MRQITSSTLSNQSLATALLCHTYTADADRMLFIRLFADQVAGNGAYSSYITIQRLGTGSAYEVQPRTAPTVASGITSIAFTTIPVPVKNTDVVKVYLVGLAGDTTTPDTITEIWEDDSLLPTTTGRTLDVSSTGEAGIDWANVGSPTTTVALTGTTVGLIDGAITAAKIAADAITAAKIADGAIDAATFAAGAINAAAIATDAITAAKIAADAIGASELAADAITEIQSGLGTSANQTTIITALTAIAGYIDTEVATLLTNVAALPDASAIVTAIKAYEVETGHSFDNVMKRIYATIRGGYLANDPDDPTQILYYAPDGTTVRVTHSLTSTTRVAS